MADVVNLTTWAFVVDDSSMRVKPCRGDVVPTEVLQERGLVPASGFPVEEEFPNGIPVKGLVLVDDFPLPEVAGDLVIDELLVIVKKVFFEHGRGPGSKVHGNPVGRDHGGGTGVLPSDVAKGCREGPDRPLGMLAERGLHVFG